MCDVIGSRNVATKYSWNQHTKFKRILYYGTFLLLLMSVKSEDNGQRNQDSIQNVNLLIASCQLNSNSSTTTEICLTQGCIDAASYLISSMNKSVDPCEDFYHFSCGGWIEKHINPEDKKEVSVLSELDEKIANDLILLLEKEMNGSEADHVRKIKDVYNSCMDLRGIKKAGYEPLNRLLQPIEKGVKDINARMYDWIDTLRLIRKAGFNHNFPMMISVFGNHIKIYNLLIKFNELLDGSFFNKSFDIQNSPQALSNREQIRKIGFGLKLDMDTSLAEETISNMSAIDGIFSLITWNSFLHPELGTETKDCVLDALTPLNESNLQYPAETYKKVKACYDLLPNETKIDIDVDHYGYELTVENLQIMVPEIDWLEYFNVLFDDRIYGNDTVWIPDYYMVLSVANFMKGTKKRPLLAYYLWQVVKEYDDLLKELTQKEESRGRRCLGYIEKYLGIALGSFYIKRYPKEEEKEKIAEMVNYIKNEFVNILESKTFIESDHKDLVKKKVMGIVVNADYPKELLDDEIISNLYKDLKIETDYYIDNHMRMKKLETDENFSKIRKKTNGWKQFARTMDSEIRYDLSKVGLNLPAGRLQSPYFDNNRPQYLNFGALGSVIGHGIAYLFNYDGDSHEDENAEPWWGTDIELRYNIISRCIIEQYRNYTERMGLKPTSNITKEVYLADTLGLKLAYLAYNSWVENHGTEIHLPGLQEYTPKQLFWISAASGMCGKYRKESLDREKQTNLLFLRVLGSLSNRPEFANDFKCKVGSKMNPEKTCQYW